MVQLTFSVSNEGIITRTDSNIVIADSIGEYEAVFSFGTSWESPRTALFKNESVEEEVVLVADSCVIPSSVLVSGGSVRVSAYAGNLKTTVYDVINLRTSGYFVVTPTPPVDPLQVYTKTPAGDSAVELIRYNLDHLEMYNGTEWVAVTPEPPAGGYANNLYFGDSASDVVGYKVLTYTPDALETEYSNTVQSTDLPYKVFQNYIYPSGVSVSLFPAGLWSFNFYGRVDSPSHETQLGIAYFKRSAGGVETDLFTAWGNELNNTIDAYIQWQVTNPSYVVDPTDRMGARIIAKTTRATPVTVTYKIGDGYGAYLSNPNKIRHSQLRDFNGDPDYQHIDSGEKTLISTIGGKIDKTTNVTAINDTGIADGEIAVFNLTGKDIRTSNVTIATTLGADDTTVPTSKAVSDVVGDIATALDTIVGV